MHRRHISNEERRRMLAEDTNLYPDGSFEQPDGKFGNIPAIEIGHWWETRRACCADRVHAHPVFGICGDPLGGAYSIVLSGEYEDDQDRGDSITYTGVGGRDGITGRQTSDQDPASSGNRALKSSLQYGRAVRVIRKSKSRSPYTPASGYRYDGLYKVTRATVEQGSSGFNICKFELQRVEGQPPLPTRSI